MDEIGALACPHCRCAIGQTADNSWTCAGCAAMFGGLRGIPDLRVSDDIFMPNGEDWSFARRLDSVFDRLDFRGLLDYYFDLSPEIPADLRRRQIGHILSAPGRARQWLGALGDSAEGPILDLGCGTGSFLAAVAGPGREFWGLDIALRWLIVARKRLVEEGLDHVRLVCGGAERLPLGDRMFAGVVAGDVIEHVGDMDATLAESYRVLRPGGRLVLASPNRFSLAPEPHVGVWGVGFLPRRWMGPYVHWVRGIEFKAIQTLGLGGWRRLLRRSPFGGGSIEAPGLPMGEIERFGPIKRRLARIYQGVVATRLGRVVARRVGPLYHVVCQRPAAGDRRSDRATPRRSRRSGAPA